MTALKTALFAALAVGVSTAALAQTQASRCPAGYLLSNGICQPAAAAARGPANAVNTASGYGSSSPPGAANPGPASFAPTSYSYTAYKGRWPATGGTCPTGYVSAYNGKGCYPAH